MLLALTTLALAADPALLPITADPRVGDHVARFGLTGAGGTVDGVSGSFRAELAIASRVAVGATAGVVAPVGELDGGIEPGVPLASVEARVEILDPATSPVGLGAGVAWQKVGFDGFDGEIEARLSGSVAAGPGTVYANLRGGRDVAEPEGDVEASAAAAFPVGRVLALGADARGRVAVGDVEEAEREAEERRGWDVRGGAVLTAGSERLSGFVFGGVEAAGTRESRAVGPAAAIGLQLVL